jgi:DNA-binding NarL/FixJ family response regulator
MITDDDVDHEARTITRLIVAGHGDQYIADQLLISPRTMYRVLERFMLRHNLPNRAALGAFAAARGWLPDYPPAGSHHPRSELGDIDGEPLNGNG